MMTAMAPPARLTDPVNGRVILQLPTTIEGIGLTRIGLIALLGGWPLVGFKRTFGDQVNRMTGMPELAGFEHDLRRTGLDGHVGWVGDGQRQGVHGVHATPAAGDVDRIPGGVRQPDAAIAEGAERRDDQISRLRTRLIPDIIA